MYILLDLNSSIIVLKAPSKSELNQLILEKFPNKTSKNGNSRRVFPNGPMKIFKYI